MLHEQKSATPFRPQGPTHHNKNHSKKGRPYEAVVVLQEASQHVRQRSGAATPRDGGAGVSLLAQLRMMRQRLSRVLRQTLASCLPYARRQLLKV